MIGILALVQHRLASTTLPRWFCTNLAMVWGSLAQRATTLMLFRRLVFGGNTPLHMSTISSLLMAVITQYSITKHIRIIRQFLVCSSLMMIFSLLALKRRLQAAASGRSFMPPQPG